MDQLQVISTNWTPARFRAWALCDFRPSSFSGTNTSCRIAWFSPTGKITDAAQLWTAVAIWTEVEVALRGKHMRIITEAHRALTVLVVKRYGKLGWPSILHLLEARAMRLRAQAPARVHPQDNPTARATYAFTIKPDDRDVKQVCDVPILAPMTIKVREERPDREQRPKKQQQAPPAPPSTGGMVPDRFMALENVCFEWMAAECPEVTPGTPCPSNAGPNCQWDHHLDSSVSRGVVDGFAEWCKRRTHHQSGSSTSYHRRAARRRGRGRP